MKMRRAGLPFFIARCLWSYDLSALDIHRDRESIIAQVLNYGDWKGLKWLAKTYPKGEIRRVVAHPRRGVWFEQVLNFWCLILKIKLPRAVRERAIFRLEPNFGKGQAAR